MYTELSLAIFHMFWTFELLGLVAEALASGGLLVGMVEVLLSGTLESVALCFSTVGFVLLFFWSGFVCGSLV